MIIAVVVLVFLASASSAIGQSRVPWTTSQIDGHPEPPKAFVQEQVFAKMKFAEALELAAVPGSDRLLIVERRGKISSFSTRGDSDSADLILDLLSLHPKLDHAFGIVLHPRFRETRQIFVCYALPDGQVDGSRVSRFTLTSLDPLRADPQSEEIILTWRSGGHNGGSLQFGPDGYLYVSTGDAGPAAPPDLAKTGQDTSDFLASILRIDVDHTDPGRKYRVPADNPWIDATAGAGATAGVAPPVRPELWAYGLRNPWKMSFDRTTGDLWCGDIGWELWEMVHLIKRGGNYGWSAYEASQPIRPELANPLAPITKPIVAHAHSEAASITGGFVYRGKQFPELARGYVYGDFVTGKIWALWYDGQQITRHEEIADTPHSIVAFGEDDAGELYYLHYAGQTTIHRLVRNPQAVASSRFPRRLSATGLFADVARQQPAAGVYPYSITSPLWEDGAAAQRWIALRDTSSVVTTVNVQRDGRSNNIRADYSTKWPKDAVLARTITRDRLALTPAERSAPIETQVLHFDGEAWNAYAYRWNDTGTDAELVPPAGSEMTLRVAADANAVGPRSRELTWRFQSRAECLRCHNTWNNGTLAFTPSQLRGSGRRQMNQFIDHGIVNGDFFEQTRLGGESSVGDNRSARAVLHANCAHCHTAHAGGAVSIFLNQELLTGQMNIVDVVPSQGGLGLKQPKLVDPGDPWNSVLAVRMAKTGAGHMPLAGSREVDIEGLKTIEDWIARMPSNRASPKPWTDTSWDQATIERELLTVNGAMRLRRAIDDGKLDAAQRAAAFKIAWASPESTVRDIFERFKPDEQRERTLGAVIDSAALLRLPSDAARGARLVSPDGKLASCQACHFIQGQGRHFGPDLSRIGAQQSPAQILESIVAPSKTVAPLYRTTVIALRDGTTQAGFVRARGVSEIVLTIPSGQSVRIKHTDVAAENVLLTSSMPEGQLQGLTAQEAADLVAYLASLK
jgi:putative heme-binding domain-containing protein